MVVSACEGRYDKNEAWIGVGYSAREGSLLCASEQQARSREQWRQRRLGAHDDTVSVRTVVDDADVAIVVLQGGRAREIRPQEVGHVPEGNESAIGRPAITKMIQAQSSGD